MALNRGNVSDKPASAAAAAAPSAPVFDPAEFAAAPPPPPAAPAAVAEAPQADDAGSEVEVEVEAEIVTGSESAGTALAAAPAQHGQMVSTGALVVEQMAADGMEGMDLGFGAFPVIKLATEGKFESQEFGMLGDSFDCVIMQSRNKFICKNGLPDTDKEADFFYSYYSPTKNSHLPQVTANGDKPIEDILTEWKLKGWKPEWKTYLEVVATMYGGDHDGQIVTLQIPPKSITRFSGYTVTARAKTGLRQDQFVTRVKVGKKVTTAVKPFYPWAFELSRTLDQDAA